MQRSPEHGQNEPATSQIVDGVSRRGLFIKAGVYVATGLGSILALKNSYDSLPPRVRYTPTVPTAVPTPDPEAIAWRNQTEREARVAVGKYIKPSILAGRPLKLFSGGNPELPDHRRFAEYDLLLGQDSKQFAIAVANLYEDDGRLSATGLQAYVFKDHGYNPSLNTRIANEYPEIALDFCRGIERADGTIDWTECEGFVKGEFVDTFMGDLLNLPDNFENHPLERQEVLSQAPHSWDRWGNPLANATYKMVTLASGSATLINGGLLRAYADAEGVATSLVTEPFHSLDNPKYDEDKGLGFGGFKHRFSDFATHSSWPVRNLPQFLGGKLDYQPMDPITK